MNKLCRKFSSLGFFSALTLFAWTGATRGQTILNSDFEAPLCTVGYLHGQNSWYALFGYKYVTNNIAHSGTQSISTMQGEASRLTNTGTFDISTSSQWWADTWVYVPTSTYDTGSSFSLAGAVTYAPYITLTGTGAVTLSCGYSAYFTNLTLGASVLDKWLHLQIIHDLGPGNTPSQYLTLRLTSADGLVDQSFTDIYATSSDLYSPVGLVVGTRTTYNPNPGIAYWDDIRAGYGPVPVPEPSTVMLVGLAVAALCSRVRRR